VNLAEFRKRLTEYTMHSMVTLFGPAYPIALSNSVARWCNTTPFLATIVYKNGAILHACVYRKIFV